MEFSPLCTAVKNLTFGLYDTAAARNRTEYRKGVTFSRSSPSFARQVAIAR